MRVCCARTCAQRACLRDARLRLCAQRLGLAQARLRLRRELLQGACLALSVHELRKRFLTRGRVRARAWGCTVLRRREGRTCCCCALSCEKTLKSVTSRGSWGALAASLSAYAHGAL